jgi:hypothetical protein
MMGMDLKREAVSRRRRYLYAKAHGNVWLVADGEITS